MKISTFAFLLFLMMSAVACQNDAPASSAAPGDTGGTDASAVPADGAAGAPNTGTVPSDAVLQSPSLPVSGTTAAPGGATAVPTGTTAAPAGKAAAGMNPAHGQPGHRCDIAVGAPLNQPAAPKGAASPVQPAVSATPSISPSATPAITPVKSSANQPAAKTAPGMNPAHGQPGHRCDIAVGAPLDSKPKQ